MSWLQYNILYFVLPYFGGLFLYYTVMCVVRGEPTHRDSDGWNDDGSRFLMCLFWFGVAPLQLGRAGAVGLSKVIRKSIVRSNSIRN